MDAALPTGADTVLFDLDGTIMDSAASILASLHWAFAELGLPPIPTVDERTMIGPPFRDTLPRFVAADRIEEVITVYRGHYGRGGMLAARPYEGIPAALQGLAEQGVRLAVATSKVDAYARDILANCGLADHFEVICGDDQQGTRGTKALVVGQALERLGRPDPTTVRMIGDRHHDVHGAAAHGIATIGAGWGYGQPGELAEAGAITVLDDPAELTDTLAR